MELPLVDADVLHSEITDGDSEAKDRALRDCHDSSLRVVVSVTSSSCTRNDFVEDFRNEWDREIFLEIVFMIKKVKISQRI